MAEAIVRYHKSKGSQIGNAKNAKDNFKYLMWCRDEIGPDTLITDITDEVIQNLVNKRAQDTVHGKPISAATVNRSVVGPLRQLMNWMGLKAKIQGLHMIDWADLELDEAGPRERVLTFDELDSLRAAVVAENDGHLDAFEFALLSGFRLANFTQLCWDEVFFAPEQGYPNGKITVTQKGGGEHTIPMTIGIRELLEKLKENHSEAVFTFVAKKTWTNPKNQQEYDRGQRYPVTYYGWGSWFKDVVKRSGVKNVRTHDLRKTCGSEILNTTGNIVAAQKLLGHATVEQTARAYAFLSTDVLLNAMELVEAQKQSRHKSGTK